MFDFRPSGENFHDVPLPTSGIAVDLAAPGDTLWGWGVVELHYGVALGGKQFAAVEAFWGDRSLGISTDPKVLSFDTRDFPWGARTLRLLAYAHSGTGSLADRLGAEFVVAEVRRVLFISNNDPSPVEGLAAEPYEGRLRFRWAPFPLGTFQSYDVYAVTNPGQFQHRATIRDRRQSSWVDSLYVGGEVTYRVVVTASDRSNFAHFYFSTPRPPLSAEPLAGGRVGLTWPLSPYHANVAQIRVGMALGVESGPIAGLPGTASSYVHDAEDVFGAVRYYSLGFEGRDGQSVWSTQASVALDVSRAVRDVRYLPASGSLVALDADYYSGHYSPALLRLDPVTGREVARSPLAGAARLFASPSGARLFTTEREWVREWDPLTLALIREVAIRPLLGGTSFAEEAWATDSGTVFFTRLEELPGGGTHVARGVVALDFDAGAVVARLPATSSLASASPSGAYLTVFRQTAPEVFAFDGTTLRLVQTLPGAGFFVDDTHLAVVGASSVAVYRFPEMALLYTFPTARTVDLRSFSVEPATARLAFVESGYRSYLRQVDAQTGANLLRLRVAESFTPYTVQNRAVWGGGFYRPLD